MLYCSCASSSVHISGSHWTRNSSTHVKRRLCLTFLGSARAKTLRMDALPPEASLPRRGSMVGVGFRLDAGSRLDIFFLLVLKWRTTRVPPAYVGWEVGYFPRLLLWWAAEMPCLRRGGKICLGDFPSQVRRCLSSAGRWGDLLPPGLRFSAYGGASPRGFFMRVASSGVRGHA